VKRAYPELVLLEGVVVHVALDGYDECLRISYVTSKAQGRVVYERDVSVIGSQHTAAKMWNTHP
jgi:hypothetical protein